MAAAAGDAPGKKGGLMGVLMPVALLTLLAAGGGGLIGQQIVAAVKRTLAPPEDKHAPAAATPPTPAQQPDTVLKELAPVVTNLAAPDTKAWVRLQAAIVFAKADAPQMDVMAARVTDDILAELRTLTLADLQGGAGLDVLREDLSERVSIRSDGHIKEFIIEMLVVQ